MYWKNWILKINISFHRKVFTVCIAVAFSKILHVQTTLNTNLRSLQISCFTFCFVSIFLCRNWNCTQSFERSHTFHCIVHQTCSTSGLIGATDVTIYQFPPITSTPSYTISILSTVNYNSQLKLNPTTVFLFQIYYW